MKKVLSLVLAALMLASALCLFSCGEDETIIVVTNAYFAPFEYYEGETIKGVDVDIMDKVGEKLGKEVEFQNTEFSTIIDSVSKGDMCDCGAAGITITDARKEKVDFSTPYYTSVQYVIWAEGDDSVETVNDEYILWDALAGKTIGVQTDTTGMIYADLEINGDHESEDPYTGVLEGKECTLKNFKNAQLAADSIKAQQVDVVIIDELPAKYITDKNDGFKSLPLYYKGAEGEEDSPTEEQYAICVTKGDTELLDAINEVLEEMMKNGEVDELLMKHMGLEG